MKSFNSCLSGFFGLMLMLSGSLFAADYVWDGSAGDWNWFTATNWAGDVVPSKSSTIAIANVGGEIVANSTIYMTGSASLTITGSSTIVTLNGTGNSYSLYSDYPLVGTATNTSLNLNGSTLNTTNGVVQGLYGNANITMSNATWNMSGYNYFSSTSGTSAWLIGTGSDVTATSVIYLANGTGSSNTTTVSGKSALNAVSMFCGSNGSASMTVDDSNVNISSVFYCGQNEGSVGNLILQNASNMSMEAAGSFYSGVNGDSVVDISGGSQLSCGSAVLGQGTSSSSVMNVSGDKTRVTVNNNLSCGVAGASQLNVDTGATVTVGGVLSVGELSTLNINGGVVACNSLEGHGDVDFISGELVVLGDMSVGTSYLLGERLTLGDNTSLSIYGVLTNEIGGTISVAGGIVDVGSFNNLSDVYFENSTVYIDDMDNEGYLNIDGGTINSSNGFTNNVGGYIYGRGIINNTCGLAYNAGTIQASRTLNFSNSIENHGSMVSSSYSSRIAIGGDLYNYGDVTLSGGSLSASAISNEFSGSISGWGTVDAGYYSYGGLVYANGGTLNFTRNIDNVKGGQLKVADNAALRTADTTISNSGQIKLMGENSSISSGGNISNYGTLKGLGWVGANLLNGGTVTADGGMLTVSGLMENGKGGIVEVMDGATLSVIGGLYQNSGNIYLYGGRFDNGRNSLYNYGNVIGNGSLAGTSIYNGSVLSVGGGDMSVAADAFCNEGIVNVADDCTLIFFCSVSGSGSFSGENGTVVFLADYVPGKASSAGIIGDIALMGGLSMALDGSESNQLIVGNELIAGGDLAVSLADGYMPQLGESFDLFDAKVISGEFDDIILPELAAANMSWDTSSLYFDGVITVVPEPCTVMLISTGMVLFVGRRKK